MTKSNNAAAMKHLKIQGVAGAQIMNTAAGNMTAQYSSQDELDARNTAIKGLQ